MSDKTEYSRLLIKRATETGVVPTIPTGTTLSTFTNTDLFVGEFFLNTTDENLYVRTDNGILQILNSGFTSSIFATGFTYDNANTLTISNNNGSTLQTSINTMTGLTVNGAFSATTLFGDGSGLTGINSGDIFVTGFTYDNANKLTIVSNSGASLNTFINVMTGLTINGAISATTYYNVSSNFQYEIHVSQVDGNDTTGDGSLLNPVATITKALTLLTGSRKTIIVHPGGYSENVTVASGNTTIATSELTGANTVLYGTLTIGTLGSGSRISGLKMTNLVISGTAQAYISNCTVDNQVTKSSSGYVEIINTEMQCISGIQISGSGTTIINGNKNVGVAVSNASAQVIIKGCNSVVTPSASAGNLAIVDCIVTALGGNAITITGSLTTLTLLNSQVLVTAGNNVAPISVAGIYTIINTIYDKPGSTFTGTSTNSIDYFQFINADKFITQGGTSSQYVMGDGSLSNGFTGGTGSCITDLYVSNIIGCSPLSIFSDTSITGFTTGGSYTAKDVNSGGDRLKRTISKSSTGEISELDQQLDRLKFDSDANNGNLYTSTQMIDYIEFNTLNDTSKFQGVIKYVDGVGVELSETKTDTGEYYRLTLDKIGNEIISDDNSGKTASYQNNILQNTLTVIDAGCTASIDQTASEVNTTLSCTGYPITTINTIQTATIGSSVTFDDGVDLYGTSQSLSSQVIEFKFDDTINSFSSRFDIDPLQLGIGSGLRESNSAGELFTYSYTPIQSNQNLYDPTILSNVTSISLLNTSTDGTATITAIGNTSVLSQDTLSLDPLNGSYLRSQSTTSIPYTELALNDNDIAIEAYDGVNSRSITLVSTGITVTGGVIDYDGDYSSQYTNRSIVDKEYVDSVVGGGSTFTGGTVTGATNFTNGLTANTISATTYLNLPTDVRVTGATYNNANTFTFTNNTGGTFNTSFNTVTGLTSTGTINSSIVSATTISATTYNGDGKNLLGVGGGRGSFGITIDGGGSAITTGVKGYITVPYNGTITGWDIFGDTTGSIVVDVWKDTFATFPPTVADTIAGTEKPTLSSAVKNQDTNLTSWTTSVTAGDIVGFNVDSATTVTRVNLIIYITKS